MGQDSLTCFLLMPFTIHCWSNGLSLPPPATLVVFHSLYFFVLLSLFTSDALDCRKCCLHKEKPTQTPKSPLSPALAFAQGCSWPSDAPTWELCKVRGGCLQESSHHNEGNTDRQNTSFGEEERPFWNSSLNVKNRMSGHWQWALKLWEMADL